MELPFKCHFGSKWFAFFEEVAQKALFVLTSSCVALLCVFMVFFGVQNNHNNNLTRDELVHKNLRVAPTAHTPITLKFPTIYSSIEKMEIYLHHGLHCKRFSVQWPPRVLIPLNIKRTVKFIMKMNHKSDSAVHTSNSTQCSAASFS